MILIPANSRISVGSTPEDCTRTQCISKSLQESESLSGRFIKQIPFVIVWRNYVLHTHGCPVPNHAAGITCPHPRPAQLQVPNDVTRLLEHLVLMRHEVESDWTREAV